MNLKYLLSFTLSTFVLGTCLAQELPLDQSFEEAVRLEAEGEKRQAFSIWTSLAKKNPNNGNLQYRAGVAHLESFNEKKGALPYLKSAENLGVSKNYDPISVQETKSPITVYYYLGKAYHLNENLDRAREYYEQFTEVAPAKHFLFDDAVLGITQTENAREIMANPLNFELSNMGATINSSYPDYSPVISIDENSIFFTSRRLRADSSNLLIIDRETGGFYEDIYVSYKNREGEWQEPELLNINSDVHNATMNVSPNGQTLYLYRDDEGGSIYESTLVGESWTTPVKMPEPINSSGWETHLSASADGNLVYFISDRKGSIGGRDIWTCRKLPTGKWGEPENMGPTLNTQHDEDAVFLSPDENTLYFSSEGHSSIGGFDVFSSTKNKDGVWSKPKNIGYPLNTTDDDIFFVTSADGTRGYFSSIREEGYGDKDIYLLELPEPAAVNLTLLKGTIIPAEGDDLPDDISVAVINKKTGETSIYTPRSRDGNFIAILPPCFDYDIEYLINGEIAATDSFSVECETAYREIEKTLLLDPVLVDEGGDIALVGNSDEAKNPASFKQYFGYNAKDIASKESDFEDLMRRLKMKLVTREKVDISITGSASKVPTKTYGKNQVLADLRANNSKERILKAAEEMGIDKSKLHFVSVKGIVQGPAYEGDLRGKNEVFREYQYVEVIVK
jgi:hypothetical protein